MADITLTRSWEWAPARSFFAVGHFVGRAEVRADSRRADDSDRDRSAHSARRSDDTDACHSQGSQATNREHPQAGSCQTAKDDGGKPGVRFLARSKRGTRSMPAWLIVGTRQRRRRFCASGWEETKEGAAVWRRLQKMETGSDFAIGLISSPRSEQDTERKRRPSNDRVVGNKTEKKTVLSTCWQQEPRALPSKRLKALPDQRSVPEAAKPVAHPLPRARWPGRRSPETAGWLGSSWQQPASPRAVASDLGALPCGR